jgi:hypothetical protein
MSTIREDLKAYVDGELSEARMEEIRMVLERDAELRAEAEFFRMLGGEIKGMAREFQPKGAEKVLTQVRRRPLLRPARWVWQSAAAIVLVSFVGALLFPLFAQSKEAARMTWGGQADADMAAASVQSSKAEVSDPRGFTDTSRSTEAVAGVPKEFQGGKRLESQGGGGNQLNNKARVGDRRESPQSSSPPPLRSVHPQMLIRRADLMMEVVSARESLEAATRLAASSGGFVESSSMTGSVGVLPEAYVTMRVPVKAFDTTLQRLRDLGVVLSDTSNSEDVTAQHADLTARLKVMRAEEESYVSMLRAARRVGELLEIKERLSSIRQEIESLQAQAAVLKDQAAMSTITATFKQKATPGQPEPKEDWLEGTWATAVNGLLAVGRFIGQFLIYILVFSPVWLPIVLLIRWLNRRGDGR